MIIILHNKYLSRGISEQAIHFDFTQYRRFRFTLTSILTYYQFRKLDNKY